MLAQGIPRHALLPSSARPRAHLHPGDLQQLLFDAQEHGVEGQLVTQLVQAAQGCSGRGQQVVVTGALLLTHTKTFTDTEVATEGPC